VTPAEKLAAELGAPCGDFDSKRLSPMLCASDESAARILAQDGWLYELKLDGVRIVADKRGDRVTLGYRKLRDATATYPDVVSAVREIPEERVVLDGEIVAFDELGKPDFMLLARRIQARASDARRAALAVRAVYVVFDVLAVGERDVRGLPIEARKAILERVLPDDDFKSGLVRANPTFSDGAALFAQCKAQRLEGVVAKRVGSTYRTGDRSPDWVKVKHDLDADLVVVGWTEGEGKRSRLGSLDIASFDGERLVVRGAVGSGLDEDTIDLLLDRLSEIEVDRPVAEGRYNPKPTKRHHVKPELVVSVRYGSFTNDGMLRFPVFRGIRADVRPEDCTLGPATQPTRIHVSGKTAAVLADGTTKHALCMHYERVAAAMLPFIASRPCVLARMEGPLWPLPKWTPSWVKTTMVRAGTREVRGVVVDDLDVLVFAIEAGCVSVLAQPFREEQVGRDFLALRAPRARAHAVRDIATKIGLSCFAKTGASGTIDVVIPVPLASCETARPLAALVARLAGDDVEVLEAVTAPWSVVVDGGRARVSVPIEWDDLERESPAIEGLAVVDDAIPCAPVAGDVASAVARLAALVGKDWAGNTGPR
jgi:bifunctional non-homologous end joining protein LigD